MFDFIRNKVDGAYSLSEDGSKRAKNVFVVNELMQNAVWDVDTLSWVAMEQPVLEATDSNFYVKLDDVESLLTDVKANQTNGTQAVKVHLIDEFGNIAPLLGDNYYQGSPITIDVEHHEIHCGDSFRACRKVDLANGASDNILIIVPNETGTELTQKKYHLTVELDTESESDYSMFEIPTVTSNGTAMTFYNRNRNSALATSLAIYHTPTTTADGTLIDANHWGAGKASGGATRGRLEWVLKNNTAYLLRITNSTTSANFISWKIDHYIHPGV